MEPIRWFMLCFFSITSKSLASCFSSAPGSHIYLSSSLPLISEFIRHTLRMEGENFMTHFVCHSTFPSAVSNRLFQPNDLSCLEVVWLKTLAYTHILKYRPLSSDWLVMPVWHSLFVVRYLACWGDNYVCLLLTNHLSRSSTYRAVLTFHVFQQLQSAPVLFFFLHVHNR